MRRSAFQKIISDSSDDQLYKLAKKYIVHAHMGLVHNSWKCDIVYDECSQRNPKIFEDAVKDAQIVIVSLEQSMNEMKVIDIKRIDYLTEHELLKFIELMTGAGKNPEMEDIKHAHKVNLLEQIDIDKNSLLCRVSGQSMEDARIFDGDILIVDPSKNVMSGNIIIASVFGELFVKRYVRENGNVRLVSENDEFEDIEITNEMEFKVIGVVRNSFRNH